MLQERLAAEALDGEFERQFAARDATHFEDELQTIELNCVQNKRRPRQETTGESHSSVNTANECLEPESRNVD